MGKSVNPLFLWSFSIAFWCFLYVYQRRISASTPKFESRHWVTLRGTSKSKTLSAPSEGCLNKSESWHGYQMLSVAIPGTQIGGSYMYLPFFCLFFRAKSCSGGGSPKSAWKVTTSTRSLGVSAPVSAPEFCWPMTHPKNHGEAQKCPFEMLTFLDDSWLFLIGDVYHAEMAIMAIDPCSPSIDRCPVNIQLVVVI